MKNLQVKQGETLETLARQAYELLAARFPVCCASDEFYFFPQAQPAVRDWSQWDDLRPQQVTEAAAELKEFELMIAAYTACEPLSPTAIDAATLTRSLCTLREQLTEIAPQRSQPTFHLSILAAGLGEALESEDPRAWPARVASAPAFLLRAASCLKQVPQLFGASAQEMLSDLRGWFEQLQRAGRVSAELTAALEAFAAHLSHLPQPESFRLGDELFTRLLRDHLCSNLDPDQARRVIGEEYAEMDALLQQEAARLAPGRRWQDLEEVLPFVEAPHGELTALYRPLLPKLVDHCRSTGLIPAELERLPSPELRETPASLLAIRASDAYAARPGHPPRGGTFFVFPAHDGLRGRTLEYRMTAAHETWPGHHLLDLARWSLPRPLRRPLERPLNYEGWACLAEELLARSGYFIGPWDRFLLARRRIERAARGIIDIELQTGRISSHEAVQVLVEAGYPLSRATAVVPRYALRPGYQACYTLGLRFGLDLLERGVTPNRLAHRILREGQIDFSTLEQLIFTGED